jgi:hypothetical protein
MWKKIAVDTFQVLSRNFPGGTVKILENPQSE